MEDLKQASTERPSLELLAASHDKDSKKCSCCQIKNGKDKVLKMKYKCGYRVCERWMCINCATIHELCRHKEAATIETLDKVEKLQKMD